MPEIDAIIEGLGLDRAQFLHMMGIKSVNPRADVYKIRSGIKKLSAGQDRLLNAYLEGYRPKDWPQRRG
jgi:hypothetical protein